MAAGRQSKRGHEVGSGLRRDGGGPSDEVVIQPTGREDVPTLFRMIRELAEYERLADAVVGDERQLEVALFESRAAEAVIAKIGPEAVGYAIYFTTFSSFRCQPGLWVEDIFVRPERRRHGIGRALLAHLAGVAVERGHGRLEWAVLDWNELALRFYDTLDAELMEQWRILRMEGDSLNSLARIPPTG